MCSFPLTVDAAFGPNFGSLVSLARSWSVVAMEGGRKDPEIA